MVNPATTLVLALFSLYIFLVIILSCITSMLIIGGYASDWTIMVIAAILFLAFLAFINHTYRLDAEWLIAHNQAVLESDAYICREGTIMLSDHQLKDYWNKLYFWKKYIYWGGWSLLDGGAAIQNLYVAN